MRAPDAGGGGPEPLTPWRLAGHAAAMLALERLLNGAAGIGGVLLRAAAGPARDQWLTRLADLCDGKGLRRMPVTVAEDRLTGGLDLAATLAAGRPIAQKGLLAEAAGGLLLIPMAERLERQTAALVAAGLDTRTGFGIVACDEGRDTDDAVPPILVERLALVVDLSLLDDPEPPAWPFTARAIAEAAAAPEPVVGDDAIAALCAAAAALGIPSLRPPIQALAAARSLARLGGHAFVTTEDIGLAAALVLAPRATRLPAPPETEDAPDEAEDEPPPDPPEGESEPDALPPLPDDLVLEAALAAIPPGLLAALAAGQAPRRGAAGKAGAQRKAATRGRVVGARRGDGRGEARLAIVETLRAAAPWQPLRRAERGAAAGGKLLVRRDDFRMARHRQRSGTTTVFVVDASGSAAAQRLAEAKGAVRLLLADCYVRRDEVALIAFRKVGAELLLPPTRSLVAAEKALAALPGGGGTPLAAAIATATQLADRIRRTGRVPALVFMTDGSANVGLNGQGGRAAAHQEALDAARRLGAERIAALLIDTSPQPNEKARAIAEAFGGRYVPLPHAQAADVTRIVGAALPTSR